MVKESKNIFKTFLDDVKFGGIRRYTYVNTDPISRRTSPTAVTTRVNQAEEDDFTKSQIVANDKAARRLDAKAKASKDKNIRSKFQAIANASPVSTQVHTRRKSNVIIKTAKKSPEVDGKQKLNALNHLKKVVPKTLQDSLRDNKQYLEKLSDPTSQFIKQIEEVIPISRIKTSLGPPTSPVRELSSENIPPKKNDIETSSKIALYRRPRQIQKPTPDDRQRPATQENTSIFEFLDKFSTAIGPPLPAIRNVPPLKSYDLNPPKNPPPQTQPIGRPHTTTANNKSAVVKKAKKPVASDWNDAASEFRRSALTHTKDPSKLSVDDPSRFFPRASAPTLPYKRIYGRSDYLAEQIADGWRKCRTPLRERVNFAADRSPIVAESQKLDEAAEHCNQDKPDLCLLEQSTRQAENF